MYEIAFLRTDSEPIPNNYSILTQRHVQK